MGRSNIWSGLDSTGAGAERTQAFMLLLSRQLHYAGGRESHMAKRLMVAVVGAGIGYLAGLLVSFLGAGNSALIVGAAAGAVIPLLVLGPPGH